MSEVLSWRETFTIGHPGLDTEHCRMVDLINEVIAAVNSKEDPAPQLKTLQEVTVEHIQHENWVLWQLQAGTHELLRKHPRMRKALKMTARSRINDHMTEHRGFLARLDTIVRDGTDTLCDELKAWFQDHAHDYDAGLKPIFQAIR